jgi:FtsP/CotA-like multicopper oxidase with cupredoxin domain
MPAMDIADVAYDRFLVNGEPEVSLDAGAGETVRLRLIDGSATTYFHLQFAGGPMSIIAADGQDVEPVAKELFLIGVAETYDVIITVPGGGLYELRATAHDGSGYASVWIGGGMRRPAPDLPRPNLYHSMMAPTFGRVFALTPAGSMGMPGKDIKRGRFDSPGMNMEMSDMQDMVSMQGLGEMDGTMTMPETGTMESIGGTGTLPESMSLGDPGPMPDMISTAMAVPDSMPDTMTMDSTAHAMPGMEQDMAMEMEPVTGSVTPGGRMFGKSFRYLAADVSSSEGLAVDGMGPRRPGTPYRDLRATHPTTLDEKDPVREVRLTLDGDMERYVWFLNKKPLSETDSILIRQGERVRFIMINRTMMHHPMHLHGHFFRVINGQGHRSPLKHTVDVAPMSTTIIEFAANEVGDWFFHCHLLYHMKSGMARLVHYDGFDPGTNVNNVRSRLYRDPWYFWGSADLLGNMTEGALVAAKTRHILMLQWETGWENVPQMEREGILTWNLYLNRFSSVFAGAEYEETGGVDETHGVVGLRYLLPLNIESFAWVDEEGDNRYGLEKEFMLTPRLSLFGEWEYDTLDGHEGNGGLSFMLSKGVSLLVQRHSEYEWGGGVQVRF